MKTNNTIFLLLTVIFNFLAFEAYAWSCQPLTNRVIIQCNGLICNDMFFVRDIKANNRCKRMPKIIDPPEWAKPVVEYELKANKFSNDAGIYELVLFKNKFKPNKTFRNIKEYIEIVETNDTSYRAIKNLKQFRQFEKLDESSFELVHQQWKSEEQEKYREFIIWKASNWSMLIFSSVLLLLSMLWFYRWINGTKKMKWLVFSLTIQILIVYSTVWTVANSFSYIYMISLLGILMPGVWLFELVLLVYTKTKHDKPLINRNTK